MRLYRFLKAKSVLFSPSRITKPDGIYGGITVSSVRSFKMGQKECWSNATTKLVNLLCNWHIPSWNLLVQYLLYLDYAQQSEWCIFYGIFLTIVQYYPYRFSLRTDSDRQTKPCLLFTLRNTWKNPLPQNTWFHSQHEQSRWKPESWTILLSSPSLSSNCIKHQELFQGVGG